MIPIAHTSRSITPLLCGVGLFSWLLLSPTTPAIAQPSSEPTTTSDDSTSRTVGGGTRGGGSCAVAQEPGLTALVPKQSIEQGDGQSELVDLVTFTQQEDVALYVYIPPASAQLATLVMRDRATQQALFFHEFDLTHADSIAQLMLPAITNANYTWQLTIDCGNDVEIAVRGEVQRLTSDANVSQVLLWPEQMAAWLAERETDPTAWQTGLGAQDGLAAYSDRPVQTYILAPEIVAPESGTPTTSEF
ncbi:MAG: DUF928 domain-containing protein [Spirulina sp. SIO3F2]|nr:DUF928 domain-containing protein [Spirulina sp. SIO3F2]